MMCALYHRAFVADRGDLEVRLPAHPGNRVEAPKAQVPVEP